MNPKLGDHAPCACVLNNDGSRNDEGWLPLTYTWILPR